jgi:hypothetical protein
MAYQKATAAAVAITSAVISIGTHSAQSVRIFEFITMSFEFVCVPGLVRA